MIILILLTAIMMFLIGYFVAMQKYENSDYSEVTEEIEQDYLDQKDDFILNNQTDNRDILLKQIFRELSILGKLSNHTKKELYDYHDRVKE